MKMLNLSFENSSLNQADQNSEEWSSTQY